MSLFTTTQTWFLFHLTVLFYILKKHNQKSLLIIIGLVLIITLADQGAGIFKEVFERLRPSHDPDIAPLSHNFLKKGGLYSFVSAHSANAFSFAVFSSLLFRNKLYSFFIFIWALLIAYTRVYLGVHFPADIICGGLLGSLIGLIVFRILLFSERFTWASSPFRKNPLSNREVSFIILSALSIIITIFIAIGVFIKYQLIKV
jgi:undecaprenyl-diphosphatase